MIILDHGADFSGAVFKDFLAQYEIEQHVTSFQQSSSNSTVERLHSTLTEIYRIILSERKELKLTSGHDEILFETIITYFNLSGRTHIFKRKQIRQRTRLFTKVKRIPDYTIPFLKKTHGGCNEKTNRSPKRKQDRPP